MIGPVRVVTEAPERPSAEELRAEVETLERRLATLPDQEEAFLAARVKARREIVRLRGPVPPGGEEARAKLRSALRAHRQADRQVAGLRRQQSLMGGRVRLLRRWLAGAEQEDAGRLKRPGR